MAVRKPIIGAFNGSCANFIKNNKIDYCCQSRDIESLVNIIKTLDITELKDIGKHSKNVYQNEFKKSYFAKALLSELHKSIN